MKLGLTSVTFKRFTAQEIARIANSAGLSAIEWNAHHLGAAKELKRITSDNGLICCSYGSNFYLGNPDFERNAEICKELGAETVRIWAGKTEPKDCTGEMFEKLAADLQTAAQTAAGYGITVSLEYHKYTYNMDAVSSLKLMNAAGRKNIFTYWQQPFPSDYNKNIQEINKLNGRISNVHLYNPSEKQEQDYIELATRKKEFTEYLKLIKPENALIEFVKGGSEEQFFRDAETLSEITKKINE